MSLSGTYRLGDEIGRGALGRVMRVHDEDSGAVLAGKILHPSHHTDARAVARFEAEAALLVGIDHPNLARVHGLVEIAGEQVLLMELVDGPSLAEIVAHAQTAALDRGPAGDGGGRVALDPDRIRAIGRGIAAGLGAAHRAGVIHRDLKPANVLLAGGETPKIVDFGMARATSFAGVDAAALAIAGTPDYMAPEAVDPLAVDARSDLYSLGCVLHELVTGRPPYAGATAFAVLEAHRDAAIPAIPGAPDDLAGLISWLLAKSPADRPQSAQAVERALTRPAASQALIPASRPGALGPAQASCALCGAGTVAAVPVCFACGAEQVRVQPGPYTVFVTGPGKLSHKIHGDLRQRLIDWLRGNPSLGLDPRPLAEKAPRLPFVLATGVARSSAVALVRALAGLGITATTRRGGRFSLPGVRRKAWVMSGRIAAIGRA